MKKNFIIQSIVITVLLAIFGAAGFFVWRSVRQAVGDKGLTTPSQDLTPVLPFVRRGGEGSNGQEQTYTHPDYGFTFKYPAGFTLGKFPEGEGEVILVQGTNPPNPLYQGGNPETTPLNKGDEGGFQGFQIFISPYTEKEEFSKEVILKADPKMKIENEKYIEIGGVASSGETATDVADSPLSALPLRALSFDSENESTSTSLSTGGTHEVWFVADGNLYQFTSFKDYGAKMEEVLQSITFN